MRYVRINGHVQYAQYKYWRLCSITLITVIVAGENLKNRIEERKGSPTGSTTMAALVCLIFLLNFYTFMPYLFNVELSYPL